MKILVINNDGGGFAGHVDVADGTTVQQLFESQVKSKPENYLIRVNRQPVPPEQVLQEADRVSFTPTKIEKRVITSAFHALTTKRGASGFHWLPVLFMKGSDATMSDELAFPRLWRFASKFRDRLTAATFAEPMPLPQVRWSELLRIYSRLHFVQARKWPVASESLRTEATSLTWSLLKHFEECQKSLALPEPALVPTVFEIVADLRALPDEFSDVRLDLKERKLSVVTDEIELEGVYLGRFQILLELSELGGALPYAVIALDPNPPGCDEDLTHPHVREQRLCEGEGNIAIRQALQQGRLFDFFLLVRQILETYNSGSAYTSLSNWGGRDCSDCGRRTYEDESTTCDRCSDHICFDCSSRCEQCDRYCCSTCCTTCTECSENVCNACASNCSDCDSPYCSKCMAGSTCSTCKNNQEPESDAQPSVPNTTVTASEERAETEVHPLGVGQAAVPA